MLSLANPELRSLLIDQQSIYHYPYGINFRAVAAFIIGVAPNLPGFINSIRPSIDVGVGKRPYTFAWLLGFIITSLVYVVFCAIWKPIDTMVPRAILPDEVYDGEAGNDEKMRSQIHGRQKINEEDHELRVV